MKKVIVFLIFNISILAVFAQQKKQLYKVYNGYFPIGTAISPEVDLINDGRKQFIVTHYNSVTPENQMKPKQIQPKRGVFKWEPADKIVAFAKANGMKVRGHTLVWYQSTPDWMWKDDNQQPVSKSILYERMKAHIDAVVNHFGNDVYCWDVVNEAISDNKNEVFRAEKDPFYKIAGEEYVEMAFRFAKAANPKLQLFYNDYRFSDPLKRQKIYQLLKTLKEKGVPIDGVGLQSHLTPNEMSAEYLQETIDMFSDLGLKIQITELDVSIYNYRIKDFEKSPFIVFNQDTEKAQATYYKQLFEVYRKNKDVITGVTFWGATDLNKNFRTNKIGRMDYPFLFNEDLTPKKAFYEIIKINK